MTRSCFASLFLRHHALSTSTTPYSLQYRSNSKSITALLLCVHHLHNRNVTMFSNNTRSDCCTAALQAHHSASSKERKRKQYPNTSYNNDCDSDHQVAMYTCVRLWHVTIRYCKYQKDKKIFSYGSFLLLLSSGFFN
jgi:hypothetical protein